VVQLLLERGADVAARDMKQNTPLMISTSVQAVKLLLAAGADVAAVGDNGQTALHCLAAAGACAGTACLLLKAGADPTATMQFDDLRVTAAVSAGVNGHFALEALLSRAADDYRKKHSTTASSATGDSNCSSSNGSSVGSSGADRSSSNGNGCVIAADTEHSENVHNVVADTPDSDTIVSVSATADSHTGATTSTGNKDSSSSNAVAVRAASASDTSSIQQQQQCKQRKTKQPCANCSKPTAKLCKRCAAVYYCSVECQKACFADAQHRAQCEAKALEGAMSSCMLDCTDQVQH
jgi:Ankyrin repeats (3 copies)/MYND finger